MGENIKRERETTLSKNRKKERLRECSCHSKLVIRRLLKEKERAGLTRRPSCSEERGIIGQGESKPFT